MSSSHVSRDANRKIDPAVKRAVENEKEADTAPISGPMAEKQTRMIRLRIDNTVARMSEVQLLLMISLRKGVV